MDPFFNGDAGTIDDGMFLDDGLSDAYTVPNHATPYYSPYRDDPNSAPVPSSSSSTTATARRRHAEGYAPSADPYALAVPGVAASAWLMDGLDDGTAPGGAYTCYDGQDTEDEEEEEEGIRSTDHAQPLSGSVEDASLHARLQALTQGAARASDMSPLLGLESADTKESDDTPYAVYNGEDDESDDEQDAHADRHRRSSSGSGRRRSSSSDDDDVFQIPAARLSSTNPHVPPSILKAAAAAAYGTGGGGGIDDGLDGYVEEDGYSMAMFSQPSTYMLDDVSPEAHAGTGSQLYCLDPEGGLGESSEYEVSAVSSQSSAQARSPNIQTHLAPQFKPDEGPKVSSYRPHDARRAELVPPRGGGGGAGGPPGTSDCPFITVTRPTGSGGGGRLVMSSSAADAAEMFLNASRHNQQYRTQGAASTPADATAEIVQDKKHVPDASFLTVPRNTSGHTQQQQQVSQAHRGQATHHHHHHGRKAGSRMPHAHSLETCEGSCENRSLETLDSLLPPSSSIPEDMEADQDADESVSESESEYTVDDDDDDDDDDADDRDDCGTACGSVRTVNSASSHPMPPSTCSTSQSTPVLASMRQTLHGAHPHHSGLSGGGLSGSHKQRPVQPRHAHAHREGHAAPKGRARHQQHEDATSSSSVIPIATRQSSTLSVSDETSTSVPSQRSTPSVVDPLSRSSAPQPSLDVAPMTTTAATSRQTTTRTIVTASRTPRSRTQEDGLDDETEDSGMPLRRGSSWRHTDTTISNSRQSSTLSTVSAVLSESADEEEGVDPTTSVFTNTTARSRSSRAPTSQRTTTTTATTTATTMTTRKSVGPVGITSVPAPADVSQSSEMGSHVCGGPSTPRRNASPPHARTPDVTSDTAHADEEESSSPNVEEMLSQHNKHVFVFTSAGRPVFTRYGDCNELSGLFGVLQVLMSIAAEGASSVPLTNAPRSGGGVDDGGACMIRHIYSRQWRAGPSEVIAQGGHQQRRGGRGGGGETLFSRYLQNETDPLGLFNDDVSDDESLGDYGARDGAAAHENDEEEEEGDDDGSIADSENVALRNQNPPFTFHFYQQGELRFVMATRHVDENASYCTWQLALVHLFMLSVLPTVHDMLREAPGYDVRRHFSVADLDLLRNLLKRCSNDVGFVANTMEWAVSAASRSATMDRSLPRRAWFEQQFARYHQRAVPLDEAGLFNNHNNNNNNRRTQRNAHHLFSFVFYHGRLVAAAGEAGAMGIASASPSPSSTATARARHPAHGLAMEDLFLLEHFASHVVRRQRGGGANWAPICLPCFNRTGYVWAYVCDLSTRVREAWWSAVLPPLTDDTTRVGVGVGDAGASAPHDVGRSPLSPDGARAAPAEAVLIHTASSLALPFLASAEGRAPGLLYVQISASPNDSSYCDDNTTLLCQDLLAPPTLPTAASTDNARGASTGRHTLQDAEASTSPALLGLTYFAFEEDLAGRPIRGGHARLWDRYREEQPVHGRRMRRGGSSGDEDDAHSEWRRRDNAEEVLSVLHSDNDDMADGAPPGSGGGGGGGGGGGSLARSFRSSSSSSFFRPQGMPTSTAAASLWSRPSLIRHVLTFGTHLAAAPLHERGRHGEDGSGGGGGSENVDDMSRATLARFTRISPPPAHASVAVSALHHLPSLEDQLFCVQWFSLVGCSAPVAAERKRRAASSTTTTTTTTTRDRASSASVGMHGLLTSGSGGCESTLLSVGKRERKSVLRRLNNWTSQLRQLPCDPSHFACLVVEEADFSAVLLVPTATVMTTLCQQVYPSEDVHSRAPLPAKSTRPTASTASASASASSVRVSRSPAFDKDYARRCPYALAHPPYVFSEFLNASQAAVEELVVVFVPGTAEVEMLYWAMRLLHGVVTLQDDLLTPLHVSA